MPDEASVDGPRRDLWPAMVRGFLRRCPRCGKGVLFASYLQTPEVCAVCGQPLSVHRADDAPPYFTILIVGHVLGAAILIVEREFNPPVAVELIVWPALAVIMSLLLLPRIKGALIGLQWAFRMAGFGEESGQPGNAEST